jgi:hypothetical protein
MRVNRCFILRGKGFSCSLDILLGNIGINTMQFQKIGIFFNSKQFTMFDHKIPGSRSVRIDLKCWIRIRIDTSAVPQHCMEAFKDYVS